MKADKENSLSPESPYEMSRLKSPVKQVVFQNLDFLNNDYNSPLSNKSINEIPGFQLQKVISSSKTCDL